MFNKLFEKEYGIIVKEENLIKATRLFNALSIKDYRFVEISAGCKGAWFIGFTTNKMKFLTVVSRLNIEAITHS